MKKSILVSLLTITYIFFLNYSATSQVVNNTVSGFVFDLERRPLSQMQVELLNEFNSVLQRMKTDAAGRYLFRGVPSGRLYIRVLPLGSSYEEQIQEIEITNVGALGRRISDNIQKDFYLKIRKNNNSNEVNSVLFAQEIPPDAKKLYEQGVADLEKENTKDGIAKIESAIAIFPTYFLALERLGLEYLQQQKFEESKKVLMEALNTNPRCFNCLYGICYSNYSLNNFIGTIEYAKKTIEIDRKSSNAFLLLGLSYRATKDYKNAKDSLIEAKKNDKENPDINWNLALLYAHNLKQYDDAASELELYLKNSPDLPDKDSIKKLIKQFRDKAKQSN